MQTQTFQCQNPACGAIYAGEHECNSWDSPDSLIRFSCTIYDKAEGKIHVSVDAKNEDVAYEEASIAASERGCSNVTEIVVGVFE